MVTVIVMWLGNVDP